MAKKKKKTPQPNDWEFVKDGINEDVDLKQLRDVNGFINAVDKFIQDAKSDVSALTHFADTYAKSKSADSSKDQKMSMFKIKHALDSRFSPAIDSLEGEFSRVKTSTIAKGAPPVPHNQGGTSVPKTGVWNKLSGMFGGKK